DLEDLAGKRPKALADGPAAEGFEGEDFDKEEVECPLYQVRGLAHIGYRESGLDMMRMIRHVLDYLVRYSLDSERTAPVCAAERFQLPGAHQEPRRLSPPLCRGRSRPGDVLGQHRS